jgi:hypothetical protein
MEELTCNILVDSINVPLTCNILVGSINVPLHEVTVCRFSSEVQGRTYKWEAKERARQNISKLVKYLNSI